ncbi:hypothetical protein [Phyllobacterium sp. P30BS-XVII]|uniref:hypothetical protein n=1 Tax=Phyllobacterium sp. P30BS-XVII TaxID=2587046 RepID=UPI0015FB643E|nr:hypothetical protein [Phyllobacterium sp. P30BS-XVII]MBA8904142.1 hypothetical protein [Phyllobacterium sp. P30BS-XVII]
MTADIKHHEEPYDASRDAHDSYFLAVEMKRRRGDRHWPEALCLVTSGPVPATNTPVITIENTNLTSRGAGHDD